MSVAIIFEQLHDPTTWPAPPERARRPATLADFRPFDPAALIPMPIEALRPWTPPPREVDEG